MGAQLISLYTSIHTSMYTHVVGDLLLVRWWRLLVVIPIVLCEKEKSFLNGRHKSLAKE